MANGKEHQPVGTICGGAAALFLAKDQPPLNALAEMIGGCVGGNIGSRAPDWVDPPLHPRHRSFGHGVLPTSSLSEAYLSNLGEWQESLRKKSEEYSRQAQDAQSEGQRVWLNILSLICLLLSGALAGFPAGYLSHLVMDAKTKFGLPLVA